MLAYHSDDTIKTAILAQLAMHREADQLVKGQYWEDGKGCAVGCTLHSGDHMEYETRFGIPVALARLEDRLLTDETINLGINHPLVKDAIRQCAASAGYSRMADKLIELIEAAS
jgi:hypothetical protein